MLGFSIRKAFYDGWDHILELAAMNLVYVLMVLGIYLVWGFNIEGYTAASLILISIIVLLYCIFSLGVYRNAYCEIRKGEVYVKPSTRGRKKEA